MTVLARSFPLAAALSAALLLSACGASPEPSPPDPASTPQSPAAAEQMPVTVTHAFGTTTIEKRPTRIATVGWGNHEVPLALGVVPVGMSKATWGDDDADGVLPWVEKRIEELGGQTPVLFDDTDSIDFEAVADTKPDVILAAYSGLTKEQYDTLSQIAPVVAYPKTPWATSMNDMVKLDSQGMGRAADGEKLVADLDAQIAAAAERHPALKDKTALFALVDPTDMSKIGFYNNLDPRQQFLTQLGMKTPKAVAATDSTNQFFSTISAERSDTLDDAQILVTYAKDPAVAKKATTTDPLWAALPPVKNGAVVYLPDDSPLAAATNPSPLAVSYGLEKYLQLLDEAAAKAT